MSRAPCCFGWTDAVSATARDLAELFLERFPEVCARGYGRDWLCAGWYVEMLGVAERGGSPVAYDDLGDGANDYLATTRGDVPELARIIAPPGGLHPSVLGRLRPRHITDGPPATL